MKCFKKLASIIEHFEIIGILFYIIENFLNTNHHHLYVMHNNNLLTYQSITNW